MSGRYGQGSFKPGDVVLVHGNLYWLFRFQKYHWLAEDRFGILWRLKPEEMRPYEVGS